MKIEINNYVGDLSVVDKITGKTHKVKISPLTMGRMKKLSNLRVEMLRTQKEIETLKADLVDEKNTDIELQIADLESKSADFLTEQLDIVVGEAHRAFSENLSLDDTVKVVEACIDIASQDLRTDEKKNMTSSPRSKPQGLESTASTTLS